MSQLRVLVRRFAQGSVVTLVTTVASCATVPPECRTEYGHTLSHCPKPRPQQPCDCIEICEIRGAARECYLTLPRAHPLNPRPFQAVNTHTAEAGILIEGFGLGVGVSDINDDGWPDVYVANDFITNDLLYMNNGDGTFTNEAAKYLKHQTYNGMGTDVADYNNDAKVDIVVLDMLPEDNKRWKLTSRGNTYDEFQNGIKNGYEHQYIRNTLQLNHSNGTFSEIGQIAGIEAAEWSWSALFADYDNDGLKDLFISNGYRQDIINLDFVVYGDKEQSMGLDPADDKERQALLNELPGIKVHNYMYKNKGDF